MYPGRVTREDIPTPALLLDAARFERNLARMAEHFPRTEKDDGDELSNEVSLQ